MSEDISTTVQLSVMLLLLSTIVVFTISVSTASFKAYNQYLDTVQISLHSSDSVLINEFRALNRINGANAYKFISTNEGVVESLSISYLKSDGTYELTGDFNTLLDNASASFQVTIGDEPGGKYRLVLTEVER